MAERQSHGFEYEKIVSKNNDLSLTENYTGIWDAYNTQSVPYLIKTFKKGSEIPLSDIFINCQRNRDFYLAIGIWESNPNNIVEEYLLLVEGEKFTKLFEFSYMEEMKNWIKTVSNHHEYDSQWKKDCKEWKLKWGKDRIVQPRFKRDHKKQKRIQSAVSYKNINKFLEIIAK